MRASGWDVGLVQTEEAPTLLYNMIRGYYFFKSQAKQKLMGTSAAAPTFG